MNVYVKTQAELDALPLDTRNFIYINFGTKENPAIIREQYHHPVIIINNNVVAAYDNSKVWARNNSIVYAHDNSEVIADDNSEVYTYDNNKVWAWNDKCIVSINNNAIATSPSILCSGAELLNQCNGNIGNVSFTVSNVPDRDKNNVFGKYCHIGNFSKRAFVLTMRGVPYYCVYDFDTMSVKFYAMNFCRAFKNIADDAVLSYYLDNVLMPALVNTKFDKSAKSNII